MTARQYVTIWCDERHDGHDCGAFFSHSNDSVREARSYARDEGWRRGPNGAGDRCPFHADLVPSPSPSPEETET